MTALCLNNFQTPEGKVFIKGNWYSPTDKKYLADFTKGKGRVPLQPGGWALMRAVENKRTTRGLSFTDRALKAALRLPDEYRDGKYINSNGECVTRHAYRYSNSEYH